MTSELINKQNELFGGKNLETESRTFYLRKKIIITYNFANRTPTHTHCLFSRTRCTEVFRSEMNSREKEGKTWKKMVERNGTLGWRIRKSEENKFSTRCSQVPANTAAVALLNHRVNNIKDGKSRPRK